MSTIKKTAHSILAITLIALNPLPIRAAPEPSVQTQPGVFSPVVKLTVEPGHSWLPPYGLERVGQPLDAVVAFPEGIFPGDFKPAAPVIAGFRNGRFGPGVKPPVECVVVGYRDGKEISRQPVTLRGYYLQKPALTGRVALKDWPSEIALVMKRAGQAAPQELARIKVTPPPFEADAVARPDRVVNPVDLGAILVPNGWLLLQGGQRAAVDVAALTREIDLPGAQAAAWFASAPERRSVAALPLGVGKKSVAQIAVEPHPGKVEKDQLHVAILDGQGQELWRKTIPVMVVASAPTIPAFGAVETKLRYDMPICTKRAPFKIDYDKGWDEALKDVVVFLPNGGRFVFWRGSGYCPFWASRSNMGLCYEWAELAGPPLVGKYDCCEPLQDKELRYSRVRVVEATPARVHVRWDYQPCDIAYKVWGDYAVEDYYFYPDGFGTRTLTLAVQPGVSYETCEFLYLLPPSAYPFDYMPGKAVDILWPQGKATFSFPCRRGIDGQDEEYAKLRTFSRDASVLHRLRIGKDEPLAAIYYSPQGCRFDLPGFGPFVYRGAEATPMYWGEHWPLSRGYTTGNAANERIHETPSSLSAFHTGNPKPLHSETGPMKDAMGRTRAMRRLTFAWLIGASDADDETLRHWMQSTAEPAEVEARGARKESAFYAAERRAFRLVAEAQELTLTITPHGWCMNPVFEIANAPKSIRTITLAGQPLGADQYAWDGKTLWVQAALYQPAELRLAFAAPGAR